MDSYSQVSREYSEGDHISDKITEATDIKPMQL